MSTDALRILVVDDEPGMREGCRRILCAEGYRVDTAEDGVAGLDLLKRCGDFAGALVDLKMPRMDGLTFIEHARTHDPDLLLLVITALFFGCDPFGPFQFTTFELRDGQVGHAYADTVRTEGGYGNVTMRVVSGQLPPGIGLRTEDRTGVLYGEPTRAGRFDFTVEAHDSSESGTPAPADIISHGFSISVDSL